MSNVEKIAQENIAIIIDKSPLLNSKPFITFKSDFVTIAKGFRIKATRVEKRDELETAISEMINSKEPYFLEICVEKEDNVFPMIPSGASVSDIRLE